MNNGAYRAVVRLPTTPPFGHPSSEGNCQPTKLGKPFPSCGGVAQSAGVVIQASTGAFSTGRASGGLISMDLATPR